MSRSSYKYPIPCNIAVALVIVGLVAHSNFAAAQTIDTVRAGKSFITKAQLKTGRFEDEIFMGASDKVSSGPRSTKEITQVKYGATDTYLVVMATTTPKGTMVDSVWLDRSNLELVRHVEAGFGMNKFVNVSNGRIRGTVADSAKPVRQIDEPAPVYDFSVIEEIIVNLPLANGYRTVIHTYDITQGFRDVGVTVLRSETLDTPNGGRPTWVLDIAFSTHKTTRWIDRETKEGLKWSVDMGEGRSMWGRSVKK